MMSQRIRQLIDRLRNRHRRLETIEADDQGVSIRRDGRGRETLFSWPEVVTIQTYKRDLFTVDELRLVFHTDLGRFDLGEDQKGFSELADAMMRVFPTSAAGWLQAVVAPAFVTNLQTIYQRTAHAHTN